jgi:phosphoserine phosphatase
VSGLVVCLIADPARAPLESALAETRGRALGARPRWLADDAACELVPADLAREALAARIAAVIGDAPLDVAIVPARARLKRLLVSDMDSTMITIECIDELADAVGIKPEVAAITRRAMNGEIDFRAALEARVALLEGLPVTVFEQIYRERLRYMPGARTLIQTMRAQGALTALVSGGFVPFTDRVRAALGFDLAQANRLTAWPRTTPCPTVSSRGWRCTATVSPPRGAIAAACAKTCASCSRRSRTTSTAARCSA